MSHRQSELLVVFSLRQVGLTFGLVAAVPSPMVVLAAALALVTLGGRPTNGVGLALIARPRVWAVTVASPTASTLLVAGEARAAGVAAAALALRLAQLQLSHPLLFAEKQVALAIVGNRWLAPLLDGPEHASHLLHGVGLDVEQGLD
jgi:hypothetical protein